jgi:chromosome segregation ATPase
VINQAFEKISILENAITRMSEEKNKLMNKLSEAELEVRQIKGFASAIEEESKTYKLRISELENAPSKMVMDQEELDRIQVAFEAKIGAEKSANEILELSLLSANEKIESLEASISEIMMKIEEQKGLAAKAEQELKHERAMVSSYKINGFKNEFANLYQQLDYLSDEQVRTNNELQEKLEIEKTKASRAELKMAELMKCVKALNEKLCTEQFFFNEQFSQIAKSRSQFTEEVNEIFASLNEFEVKEMQHIQL